MKLVLFFLLSALLSPDSELLERFYKGVSESCVEITYTYSVRLSGIDNVGQGVLSAQGLMWKMNGNGMQMYCDASSMWILDPSLKEVVIEPASDAKEIQTLTNPASLFVRLNELFDVGEMRSTDDGKAVLYILKPKTKGDIEYFNMEIFKSDASVRKASFALLDGTLIKIEVSSMKLTPERSVEEFRPQTIFDSSWIITDLR